MLDILIRVSVQFSHSVVSNSLWPHGLQHARLPCPSPTPRVYTSSCPSSQWCHPAISSCLPLLLQPPIPPSIRVFSNESSLRMRWPKYWNFSFSIIPSKEIPGLISFRLVGSPCSPRDSQESSPTPQFKSIYSSVLRWKVTLLERHKPQAWTLVYLATRSAEKNFPLIRLLANFLAHLWNYWGGQIRLVNGLWKNVIKYANVRDDSTSVKQ